MSLSRRQLLLSFCVPPCVTAVLPARAAAPGLAIVTILDGEAFLLRGEGRLQLAEGVALQADDIVELPEKSGRLLRIEFADGLRLDLGPGARALLAPRLPGERGRARAYLLNGWAKLTMAPKGQPALLLTPGFDAGGIDGNAVLAALPDGAGQAFAESGQIELRMASPPGAAPIALKTNQWMSLPPAGGRPVVNPHPGPAFVQQVPRPFLDPLPSRAALFAGKERTPKSVGPVSYADAQDWMDNPDPALRRLALARWRGLLRSNEFRAGALMGLKAHPEWQPVLFPPQPK